MSRQGGVENVEDKIMAIKLGFLMGYSGKQITVPIELIKKAEALGFDSVWTAEAYGSDAVTPAAWILAQTDKIKVGTAIMQMVGRTPATTAMTAMTLDQLSNGRFIVGLGASGPQVVEGWHGVPYGKPVTRTKEYIQIMKKIFDRQGPVEFDGKMYQLPNKSEGTTGLGKALKSIMAAVEKDIPVYTASITPAGLAASAEVADGVFPVFMVPEKFEVIGVPLQKGFDKAGNGKSLANFDVAPFIGVIMGDDVDACRAPIKQFLALYIGGMGAKNKNFYHTYTTNLGFGDAADEIQEHYLAGDKEAAANAVPDELVDLVALVGPEARIRERCQVWKESGERNEVGTLLFQVYQDEVLDVLADEFL
jgi:F420-dependent oxidoreductase-like protein|tara:strand:- start:531 stop:1622 length:1092 start_codon:yes stop_codon:yes gene_type:complete